MSKTLFLLTVALMVGPSCTSHTISQTSNAVVSQNTPTPANSTSPSRLRSRILILKISLIQQASEGPSIRLKDGTYEHDNPSGGGGDTFHLMDVDYVELTGDQEKEAVVRLDWTTCGGSCDGGSDIFYFYSIKRGRAVLLSRIEMGSLGYDCGLKSFMLRKTNLTLETFRSCRFNGLSFIGAHDAAETGGKFLTNRFTEFVLRFDGQRFVLRRRKVFPYPEDDFRGYQPRIEISND